VSSYCAFVTGATGFIGQHLVNRLLAADVPVRILTRGTRTLPESWNSRVQVTLGDLTDSSLLSSAVAGCDLVYHLAGEFRDPARIHATNVQGTQNLLAACKDTVRQVVHLSSVGVMGVRKPGQVDETVPCHPQDAYEQSKYTAEQNVLDWSNQTGTPVTVLRPTIVFGEGRRAEGDSMLSWLRTIQSGRFVFFGKHAVANYVYVGDVVAACLGAEQTQATGVFIIADACSLTEFVSAAAQALGVPAPTRVLPLPMAYAAAILLQVIGLLMRRGSLPLNVKRVRALSNRTCFQSNRATTLLGWQPKVGYRMGLQHTVNWYRQTGQLA
jgi:nucleoside-diphosphate-sugar epimerase